MANPQKENGNTPIANEILEKIIGAGLNGTELAVVLFIIRQTYGWHKKEDEISLSLFMKNIPVSKQAICTALEKLQLVKIIRLVKKGNSKNCSNKWAFNKNYDEWQLVKKLRLVKKNKTTSQVFNKQLVKKTRHTKETNTKENTKEIEKINKKEILIFENEFEKTLNDFVAFRKSIKKPMTENAVLLLRKKLEVLGKDENERIEILERSIVNGWQGVFELKNDFKKKGELSPNMQAMLIIEKSKKEREGMAII